jgi:hypothetical protein
LLVAFITAGASVRRRLAEGAGAAVRAEDDDVVQGRVDEVHVHGGVACMSEARGHEGRCEDDEKDGAAETESRDAWA